MDVAGEVTLENVDEVPDHIAAPASRCAHVELGRWFRALLQARLRGLGDG